MNERLRLAAGAGVVAALATLFLAHYWRGFMLQASIIAAISVGALVYSGVRTSARLSRLWRRKSLIVLEDEEEEEGPRPG